MRHHHQNYVNHKMLEAKRPLLLFAKNMGSGFSFVAIIAQRVGWLSILNILDVVPANKPAHINIPSDATYGTCG